MILIYNVHSCVVWSKSLSKYACQFATRSSIGEMLTRWSFHPVRWALTLLQIKSSGRLLLPCAPSRKLRPKSVQHKKRIYCPRYYRITAGKGWRLSLLQNSGWMSGNPTLSPFSGWNELHGGSMERNFSTEMGQSGEADRRSRVLQEARFINSSLWRQLQNSD